MALLYDFFVQLIIGWVGNVFFLYSSVHAYMRVIAIKAIDTDAFLQHQLNALFSHAVAEVYQLGRLARFAAGKHFFSAEVLAVAVLTPLLYHTLIAEVADMLQY
jgi:hypothetical protein